MNIKQSFYFCLLLLPALISCEKEKENVPLTPPDHMNGLFVINEGAFLGANASITFFSSDSSYIAPDLYETVNGTPIGDILQSMTIFNNKAYLCVNNSQKTEVVSMVDFKKMATIYGANSPRFFLRTDQFNRFSE